MPIKFRASPGEDRWISLRVFNKSLPIVRTVSGIPLTSRWSGPRAISYWNATYSGSASFTSIERSLWRSCSQMWMRSYGQKERIYIGKKEDVSKRTLLVASHKHFYIKIRDNLPPAAAPIFYSEKRPCRSFFRLFCVIIFFPQIATIRAFVYIYTTNTPLLIFAQEHSENATFPQNFNGLFNLNSFHLRGNY